MLRTDSLMDMADLVTSVPEEPQHQSSHNSILQDDKVCPWIFWSELKGHIRGGRADVGSLGWLGSCMNVFGQLVIEHAVEKRSGNPIFCGNTVLMYKR
jgi:hypothetical protein